MEQPSMREQHFSADADSLRADCKRLAGIIAAERNHAQVVLSQKDTLEVVNAKLLAALDTIMPDLAEIAQLSCQRNHTKGFPNCTRQECCAYRVHLAQARNTIEEAKR